MEMPRRDRKIRHLSPFEQLLRSVIVFLLGDGAPRAQVATVMKRALADAARLQRDAETLSTLYVALSKVLHTWHTETMRAQAIAARTYGMFEVSSARAAGADWDVDPTTWFQSYRGVQFYSPTAKEWRQVETSATTRAVQSTSGEILTYKGEVIQAFFSANSGGKTCTVGECFGLKDLPYLIEVKDGDIIQAGKSFAV